MPQTSEAEGFNCTWYEIKSRDMNEKGKDFIFYNKIVVVQPFGLAAHGLVDRDATSHMRGPGSNRFFSSRTST